MVRRWASQVHPRRLGFCLRQTQRVLKLGFAFLAVVLCECHQMPLSYRVTEHGEMCDLGKRASERRQQQNLLLRDLDHNWNYQSKGGLNAK